MWNKIEEIRNWAREIFKTIEDKDCVDEWHQFHSLADVHLQTPDEPDAYGHYPLHIYVYPLVKDHLGRFSADCSKGIEIF